jgi:CheY-like chemotaxis protein
MRQAVLLPSSRPRRRACVLVAEDDTELRRLIAAILSSDGYDVVEVTNGSDLLEYMTRQRDAGSVAPDVILSDICMPGRTGFDVLRELRIIGINTPVVLMTAFGGDFSEQTARELGAVTLVEKPFEIDDLRMIVLNVAPGSSRASN